MDIVAKALSFTLNGRRESLAGLADGATLEQVVLALSLKPDRVAVEVNGEIARRANWGTTLVHSGDKVEVVHFVGGGLV